MLDLGHGKCKECKRAAVNDSGLCFEHHEDRIPRHDPDTARLLSHDDNDDSGLLAYLLGDEPANEDRDE